MNWVVTVTKATTKKGDVKEELCVIPEIWLSEDEKVMFWPSKNFN